MTATVPATAVTLPPVARSLLFLPGDRPERFDKAVASGAHALILDLEDAVAPTAKAAARQAVAQWLAGALGAAVAEGASPGPQRWLRINAADTPWFDDDLRLLASLPGAGLMLPKATAAALRAALAGVGPRPAMALVETVDAYFGVQALAAVPGLQRLAFGSVDFAAESGIADEGEALTAVRTQIVLASCQAGLQPAVDGVSLALHDDARLQADVRRSRLRGFGGKLCIHPRQVAPVAAAWAPTAAELAWAHQVLAAFEASGGAATALDGRMIDKPVVDQARRLLGSA